MKELVIISGKGGTGKTSLTASFAALYPSAVLADCDVDAADLHLILQPKIRRREKFRSGHAAVIRAEACTGCGRCADVCRFGAIAVAEPDVTGRRLHSVAPTACEGCGVCVWNCPAQAIDFPEQECGEWFLSGTRYGPLVHARLTPGAENSGKLVSLVREQARQLAQQEGREVVLVDGPPGVGCPVIAALTGAQGIARAVHARKRRQQRRMGVDGAAPEAGEEGLADELHEPGGGHQVGVVGGDNRGQFPVPGGAVRPPLERMGDGGDAPGPCPFQAARPRISLGKSRISASMSVVAGR